MCSGKYGPSASLPRELLSDSSPELMGSSLESSLQGERERERFNILESLDGYDTATGTAELARKLVF